MEEDASSRHPAVSRLGVGEMATYAHPRKPLKIVSGDRSVRLLGSDRRAEAPEDHCLLCNRKSTLQLSHVVPKWAFKWMKAEGGVRGSVRAHQLEYSEQDGRKHYQLCGVCEQYLGRAEHHMSLLARGTPTDLTNAGLELQPGPLLVGVDDKLLRRALMGILFKAHFAPSPPFHTLQLDSKFIPSLRRRLITDDFPAEMYPMFAVKWLSFTEPGINPRCLITPAFKRTKTFTSFDLMMGGWSWTILLRGPSSARTIVPPKCLLKAGEPWRVMLADVVMSHTMDPDGKILDKDLLPWDAYDRSKPCPCGLGESSFDQCCAHTWCAERLGEASRGSRWSG